MKLTQPKPFFSFILFIYVSSHSLSIFTLEYIIFNNFIKLLLLIDVLFSNIFTVFGSKKKLLLLTNCKFKLTNSIYTPIVNQQGIEFRFV